MALQRKGPKPPSSVQLRAVEGERRVGRAFVLSDEGRSVDLEGGS